MSTVTNDFSYFVKPTILDYARAIENDRHLRLLIRKLPETADTSTVELLQFQIDRVRLVFCNFTKNTVRVDNLRNLYMNGILQTLYSFYDCHIVFYYLKKDDSLHWNEVRRLEKDDNIEGIKRCALVLSSDGYWVDVSIPME
ncbi:MAG TPA: hypothetical protein DCE71_02040 [Parachlamydiales bacterium]|nr:hypothetical protein [Parachlamydiales bacterium]